MKQQTFYSFGLEQFSDMPGWALITSSEGEDPRLGAFFTTEERALAALEQRDPDGDKLYFDGSVEFAVLTRDMGIVVANDYELNTHELLLARVAKARAAGMAEEIG